LSEFGDAVPALKNGKFFMYEPIDQATIAFNEPPQAAILEVKDKFVIKVSTMLKSSGYVYTYMKKTPEPAPKPDTRILRMLEDKSTDAAKTADGKSTTEMTW